MSDEKLIARLGSIGWEYLPEKIHNDLIAKQKKRSRLIKFGKVISYWIFYTYIAILLMMILELILVAIL